MKEALEAICEANGWAFIYGRSDYQNLDENASNLAKNKIAIVCDPITNTPAFNDDGLREVENFSGQFMILTPSDFAADYKEKYRDINIINIHLQDLERQLVGDQCLQIVSWRIIETINKLIGNQDGSIVTFQTRNNSPTIERILSGDEGQVLVGDEGQVLFGDN